MYAADSILLDLTNNTRGYMTDIGNPHLIKVAKTALFNTIERYVNADKNRNMVIETERCFAMDLATAQKLKISSTTGLDESLYQRIIELRQLEQGHNPKAERNPILKTLEKRLLDTATQYVAHLSRTSSKTYSLETYFDNAKEWPLKDIRELENKYQDTSSAAKEYFAVLEQYAALRDDLRPDTVADALQFKPKEPLQVVER